MARRHPDVDYAVSSGRRGDTDFTLKTFDEAAAKVHSRAGARFVSGDDGAAQYDEDPEASVFERFQIRVNAQGRVP